MENVQTPNSSPIMQSSGSGMNGAGNQGEEKSTGALIGSIIIIIILVVGGLYLWSSKTQNTGMPEMMDSATMMQNDMQAPQMGESVPSAQVSADSAAAALSVQGSSDETAAIEKDLGNTDLSGLDSEMQAI